MTTTPNHEIAQEALDAFVESQLTGERPKGRVDSGLRALGIFGGDTSRKMPALVATRKLDMGTSDMKFFRRVRLHGQGECRVTVIVDGRAVASSLPVVMAEGVASPSVVNLRRGTAGRWILVEVVGQDLPETISVEWDPST